MYILNLKYSFHTVVVAGSEAKRIHVALELTVHIGRHQIPGTAIGAVSNLTQQTALFEVGEEVVSAEAAGLADIVKDKRHGVDTPTEVAGVDVVLRRPYAAAIG